VLSVHRRRDRGCW